MIKLYFEKKDKVYYTQETKCEQCEKMFSHGDEVYIFSEFTKKLSSSKALCVQCLKKLNKKSIGIVKEIKPAFFLTNVPKTCVPVIIPKPELQCFNGETVWSASRIETPRTKDNTVFAKHEFLTFTKNKKLEVEYDE